MKAIAILSAFMAALALTACPGPTFIVQQYRGSPRPAETIAILRVNGSDSVRLQLLDGEDVSAPIVSDGRLHIEMLPGLHAATVVDMNANHHRSAPLAFQAEAGRVYRIAFTPPDRAARVFEVDRGSDATVRDVTRSTTEDRPVPGSYRLQKIPPANAEDVGADPPTTPGDAGN